MKRHKVLIITQSCGINSRKTLSLIHLASHETCQLRFKWPKCE